MLPVTVRIMFGQTIVDSHMEEVKIEIAADGSDTVQQVKERIAVRPRCPPDPAPSQGIIAPQQHEHQKAARPAWLACVRARQAAKGGKLTADHIHLSFGPSDKFIGKQFQCDPNVNEATLTLGPFSVITWLKQFPDWSMTARLMPAPPPAPGVAIRKAAALAEGKDPDKAVAEARAKVKTASAGLVPHRTMIALVARDNQMIQIFARRESC